MRAATWLVAVALAWAFGACGEGERTDEAVVTFPTSSVGGEAEVLERQLARFMRRNPRIRVVRQRTPDAADLRHQLYVQWLNARARDPDVLQLDVVWTAEFAAAGWLFELTGMGSELEDFFPVALEPSRYAGRLIALPWFVDVGMLYYRTDLLPGPPRTQSELAAQAASARRSGLDYGLVWQGARYEGLVTVFMEYLAAFGGELLDRHGNAALDSPQGRAALETMRASLDRGIVPRAVLGFQEEQTRFAFQSGRALFMRNWPYAFALMQRPGSSVRGRFGVTAMPPGPGGRPAATLGGSLLAINANTDEPEAALRVVRFLLAPAQMLERARAVGQFPPRRSLYRTRELALALPIAPERVRSIIENAVARPSIPVYAELSDILQIHLHRCLSGQERTADALRRAAFEIDALLSRVGLSPEPTHRERRHVR